jgi:hypothetical protein
LFVIGGEFVAVGQEGGGGYWRKRKQSVSDTVRGWFRAAVGASEDMCVCKRGGVNIIAVRHNRSNYVEAANCGACWARSAAAVGVKMYFLHSTLSPCSDVRC